MDYCSRQYWIDLGVPAYFVGAILKNGPIPDETRTLGQLWINWIEKCCVFGEGDRFGKPVRLEPFQKLLFWKLGQIDDDGNRVYRFALVSLGKGSGKSPLGGWIAALDLAGPSMFAGWNDDGTPRGKRRDSPDVLIMASSYDQADLILDEVRVTFDEGPLSRFAETQKGLVQLKGMRGRARRIPATPKKADGSKATTLIVDEVHELTTDRQENAYEVAASGTGKRADSLTVLFSTAGFDTSSLFGREFHRGLRGEFGPNELFVVAQADPGLDPENDSDIRTGVIQANPLAASGVANVEQLVARFRGMPVYRAKRYHWNLWVPADESWLPTGAWDANKANVKLDPALPTFVGADMALKRDSAAVVVLQLRPDGKYQAFSRIWIPDGDLIDQDEVDDYIRTICRDFDVSWVGCDEAYWPSLRVLEAEGLPIFRMPQQGRLMVVAYAQTYQLITQGLLLHDGSPDFADQIASAAPHSSDRGWTLKKGKMKRRIDSCPALAAAVYAATIEPPKEETIPRSQIF